MPLAEFRAVPADQRRAALECLFSELPEAARTLAIQQALDADSRRSGSLLLREAVRRGERVAVAGAMLVPGRVAMVLPPWRRASEPRETLVQLLQQLDVDLQAAPVEMAQILLELPWLREPAELLEGGYQDAGQLLYMSSHRECFPCELPGPPLTWVPYEARHRARLSRLMEATYEGSRDLPILNDRRQPEEVVAGYEQTGTVPAGGWRLVQRAGDDIGCVLITRHAPAPVAELLYMGLIPAGRGCGFGRQLACAAQWLARTAGCQQLVLGVDAANDAAIGVYERVGFKAYDRRRILLKFFERMEGTQGMEGTTGTEASGP